MELSELNAGDFSGGDSANLTDLFCFFAGLCFTYKRTNLLQTKRNIKSRLCTTNYVSQYCNMRENNHI